jgi:hypothetical protein
MATAPHLTASQTPRCRSGKQKWSDLLGNWTIGWYFNHTAGEGLTWAFIIQKAFTENNISIFIYWQGAGIKGKSTALIRFAGDSY